MVTHDNAVVIQLQLQFTKIQNRAQFKYYYDLVSILCKDIQLSESVQSTGTGMAKNVIQL